MIDPREGVAADGTIATGASRRRVPGAFEPALADASSGVSDADPEVSLYVYGSVANGQAQPGRSDVDLLTIGLPPATAAELAARLTASHRDLCRSVDIAPMQVDDLVGDHPKAYGSRVFVRHYCVHLAGPPRGRGLPSYPADARAARGFNGDIGDHLVRWRVEGARGARPAELARRLARKTLLAMAGVVSVHDGTWTTDRGIAARRYPELEPDLADGAGRLRAWADDAGAATAAEVADALEMVVPRVIGRFERDIGLWD